MFAKLLKHEFRATRNAMTVLCLTALGAGVLAGCAMGYLIRAEEMAREVGATIEILCALTLTFSILFIALCGVSALILMIARFYKSRFTDEGYLTFTLPVNSHQVLLSSVVSSGVNMILAGITVFVSFLLMAFTGLCFVQGFLPDMMEALPEMWAMIRDNMTWEIAGYMALVLVDMLIVLLYQLVTIMLAITIGSLIAKKHKILASVAVYYGLNLVVAIVCGQSFFSSVFVYVSSAAPAFSPASMLAFPAILYTVIAVAGYFLMNFLVSQKLNLP